jgi:hypothetical protein
METIILNAENLVLIEVWISQGQAFCCEIPKLEGRIAGLIIQEIHPLNNSRNSIEKVCFSTEEVTLFDENQKEVLTLEKGCDRVTANCPSGLFLSEGRKTCFLYFYQNEAIPLVQYLLDAL